MARQHNPTAELLVAALVRDHPEWQAFATRDGFSVPFSPKPEHRIAVRLRDSDTTIEVAYECGGTCGRAEREFYIEDYDRDDAIEAVCDFVNSLYNGQTVVIVEKLGRITRFLRRDGITELAWFRPKK